MSHIDSRVRYTRMVIEECFLKLLEEKPVSKITVTELCRMAEINRATFYKHYLDIPDLMEKMETRIFEGIHSLFYECDDLYKTFLQMVRYVRKDIRKYAVLGSENGDREFYSKVCGSFFDSAFPLTRSDNPELREIQHEFLHAYITFGTTGIMQTWIKNGMVQPPEEVARLITSLCYTVSDGVKQGKILL